jgi:hypothetical protein
VILQAACSPETPSDHHAKPSLQRALFQFPQNAKFNEKPFAAVFRDRLSIKSELASTRKDYPERGFGPRQEHRAPV